MLFLEYFIAFSVLYGLLLFVLRIDWTPGKYKVVFHDGPEIGIKTKVSSGWLTIEAGQMKIHGEKEITLPMESIQSAKLFRQYGLGRMIRITHTQGTLFVSVVRFCIGGQYASVDFFKTGRLVEVLNSHQPPRAIPTGS